MPEIPYEPEAIAEVIRARRGNRPSTVIVVSEGARPVGGQPTRPAEVAARVADEVGQILGGHDALVTVLDGLREFAQTNPDNPQVQALHCFVLWYTRSNDAVIEARSTASRIQRTPPASPWARFHHMFRSADRHAPDERTPR